MDSFDPEDHRQFLEYFKAHVDPNDQLPVKVPGYNLTNEEEVTAEVVNWAQSYLLQILQPTETKHHCNRSHQHHLRSIDG